MKAFLTILLLVASVSSKSQLKIGARTGGNLTQFTKIEKESYDYNWGQGVYVGLIFIYPIHEELQLQSELNFSSEIGKKREIHLLPAGMLNIPEANTGQSMYALVKGTTVIHYVEIPFLARFTTGKKVKYSMSFGPFAGMLLNAKRKYSGNSNIYLDKAGTKVLTQDAPSPSPINSSFNYKVKMNDQFKHMNVGLIAGCGLELLARNGWFFIDYRFKIGMNNIDKVSASEGKHQLINFSLSTGYVISLK